MSTTREERSKRNAEIIKAYNSGLSCEEVGLRFGVTKQNISLILKKCREEARSRGWNKKNIDIEKNKDLINELRYNGAGAVEVVRLLGASYTKSYKDVIEYVKSIPIYGSENNRKCSSCGLIADKEHFYDKNPKHKVCRCKKCHAAYQKEYKEKHPEKRERRLALMREWIAEHR